MAYLLGAHIPHPSNCSPLIISPRFWRIVIDCKDLLFDDPPRIPIQIHIPHNTNRQLHQIIKLNMHQTVIVVEPQEYKYPLQEVQRALRAYKHSLGEVLHDSSTLTPHRVDVSKRGYQPNGFQKERPTGLELYSCCTRWNDDEREP